MGVGVGVGVVVVSGMSCCPTCLLLAAAESGRVPLMGCSVSRGESSEAKGGASCGRGARMLLRPTPSPCCRSSSTTLLTRTVPAVPMRIVGLPTAIPRAPMPMPGGTLKLTPRVAPMPTAPPLLALATPAKPTWYEGSDDDGAPPKELDPGRRPCV